MWNEFKAFVSKGNVMDLAVGVIIGGAFTAIVNSLVSDIVMPLIGIITGGIDFGSFKVTLPFGSGESAFGIGNFINAVIQFLIISVVVFIMVKGLNTLHSQKEVKTILPHCPFCMEEVPEGATRCPHCTSELPEPAKSQVEESGGGGLLDKAAGKLKDTAQKAVENVKSSGGGAEDAAE